MFTNCKNSLKVEKVRPPSCRILSATSSIIWFTCSYCCWKNSWCLLSLFLLQSSDNYEIYWRGHIHQQANVKKSCNLLSIFYLNPNTWILPNGTNLFEYFTINSFIMFLIWSNFDCRFYSNDIIVSKCSWWMSDYLTNINIYRLCDKGFLLNWLLNIIVNGSRHYSYSQIGKFMGRK
jgi:hypothetical protein